jgi:hypothetical protein
MHNKANSREQPGGNCMGDCVKQSQFAQGWMNANYRLERELCDKGGLCVYEKTKPTCFAGQMVGTAHPTKQRRVGRAK